MVRWRFGVKAAFRRKRRENCGVACRKLEEEVAMKIVKNMWPRKFFIRFTLPSIVSVALLGCASALPTSAGSSAVLVSLEGVTSICIGQPIPAGYVIVGMTFVVGCGGFGEVNTWQIKQPGATEIVCLASPIPPRYVIVSTTYIVGCGTFTGPNARIIKLI